MFQNITIVDWRKLFTGLSSIPNGDVTVKNNDDQFFYISFISRLLVTVNHKLFFTEVIITMGIHMFSLFYCEITLQGCLFIYCMMIPRTYVD